MFRTARVPFTIAVTLLACAAGCASPKAPPPPDPLKEQVAILQKQLLELQNVQNDTRKKVDEQAAMIDGLSSRLKTVEAPRPAITPSLRSDQKKAAAPKKKAVKGKSRKKKPVRRQES